MALKRRYREEICKDCGRRRERMKLVLDACSRKEIVVRLPCACLIEKHKQEEQKTKQQEMMRILRDRGFESGRYAQMSFAGLSDAHLGGDVMEGLDAYMRSIQLKQRNWLYLYGDYGVGKTHMAVALARKIALERHWKPALFSWAHYLSRVQQSWQDERVKVDWHLIRDSRLLVLDDMDKRAGTPWVLSNLYDIIDYRYMRQLPTIMTANRSLGELSAFWHTTEQSRDFSRALISRIMGQLGKIIHLRAEDFRLVG